MSKFGLKKFLKRSILKRNVTSDDVLNNLRKGGAEIGTDVLVYSTSKTLIDAQVPYLLKIGDHVRIAEGVKILTHDYSWAVLKRYASDEVCPGAVFGAQSAVTIGSNVFIGMNAIVTRGVTIGDNVVIGAGSVVTRDCPSNGVYAGNPAKRIMSLAEYYQKREALQFAEARDIALRYKRRFSEDPPQEIFSEYFMLFCTGAEARQIPVFRAQMGRVGNFEDTLVYMNQNPPRFRGYAEFLKACYEKTEEDGVPAL
jgi:maltose O-acetyltransferase